ncbi:hypothetical protein COCNU_scaffold000731G000020 [Cocos nucifera]|nr:hypothetical protein [Cocos nucifera]
MVMRTPLAPDLAARSKKSAIREVGSLESLRRKAPRWASRPSEAEPPPSMERMQTLPVVEEEIGFVVAGEELVLKNGEDLVAQLVHIEARLHPCTGAGIGARGRGVPFSSLSMTCTVPPLISVYHHLAFSCSINDVSASMARMEVIKSSKVSNRVATGAGIDVAIDGEQ